MSATEILREIERLAEPERQWLIDRLLLDGERPRETSEERAWSDLSAKELLAHYGAEDAIYDVD